MPQQHFNGLTEAELEALALLSEECGEVVQIIGKILRHGLDSWHPTTEKVNRDELAKECSDVLCCIKILQRDGVIDPQQITKARRSKVKKFRDRPELLHHIDPL